MFQNSRWYAFCDKHKTKFEKTAKGKFTSLEDQEPCEWNRDFGAKTKCNEKATWEFIPN